MCRGGEHRDCSTNFGIEGLHQCFPTGNDLEITQRVKKIDIEACVGRQWLSLFNACRRGNNAQRTTEVLLLTLSQRCGAEGMHDGINLIKTPYPPCFIFKREG